MHFVDHVDLEAPEHRLVDRLVEQLRDLVDTAVGRRVELDIVDEASGIDVAAGRAHAARMRGDVALPVRAGAVERFGQNARDRRLADAARSGEQVGVVQALVRERIDQRLHDVLLPDERLEIGRPVPAGEHDIGHGFILRWRPSASGCLRQARNPATQPFVSRRELMHAPPCAGRTGVRGRAFTALPDNPRRCAPRTFPHR